MSSSFKGFIARSTKGHAFTSRCCGHMLLSLYAQLLATSEANHSLQTLREVTGSEESPGTARRESSSKQALKMITRDSQLPTNNPQSLQKQTDAHLTSRNIIAWICELCDRYGAHKDFYLKKKISREKEIRWQKIWHEPLLFIAMHFKLSPVPIRNICILHLCLFIIFVGMGQNTTS